MPYTEQDNIRRYPYYEALGVTQAQFEVMCKFESVYWKAFVKPEHWASRQQFDLGLTDDEKRQLNSCILYHIMIGSTPPKKLAPYVFDVGGKFEAWIPELEKLATQ